MTVASDIKIRYTGTTDMHTWQLVLLRILKVILPLGLFVVVGFLVYLDLDVDGQRIAIHAPADRSILVDGPDPDIRFAEVASDAGIKEWSILIDPVYWILRLPRRYDDVKVTLEYKAPQVPLVQFGGLANADKWEFAWRSVQNIALEQLEWDCLSEYHKQWYLCQKNVYYQTIEEFLLQPPVTAEIVNFNFPLPDTFAATRVTRYNHELALDDYDYVIALYTQPQEMDGWLRQEFVFPLSELDMVEDGVQFVLSAPGIDDRNEVVSVRSLTFELRKAPLTPTLLMRKIWEYATDLFSK